MSPTRSACSVLLTAPEPETLARRIVAEGLSVREAATIARAARKPARRTARRAATVLDTADTRAMAKRLEAATGLKVALQHKAGASSGSVTFTYSTLDQFDDLVARLTR